MKSESESQGQREDSAVVARVCWAYFKEGQTQEAIAQRLGRRASGHPHPERCPDERLRADHHQRSDGRLRRAGGTPAGGLRAAPRHRRAGAGRRYLRAYGGRCGRRPLRVEPSQPRRQPRHHLGRHDQHRRPEHPQPPRSGQHRGAAVRGLARSTAINPYDNAAMFARALDATCYYVTAPMFADTADLRKLLMASDPVREVLQKTRRLDMALLSAVDLSREFARSGVRRDLTRHLALAAHRRRGGRHLRPLPRRRGRRRRPSHRAPHHQPAASRPAGGQGARARRLAAPTRPRSFAAPFAPSSATS